MPVGVAAAIAAPYLLGPAGAERVRRRVADQDQGVVINTGRQIGAAVGAALLPAIALAVSHTGGAPSAAGDRAAMLAGAVAGGLATVVAWRTRIAAAPATGG